MVQSVLLAHGANLLLWVSCRVYTKEGGTYEFCFDNSFSQFTPKMVFFELYSELQEISFVNGESYAEKFETSEVEADVKNRMKQSFVQIKVSFGRSFT